MSFTHTEAALRPALPADQPFFEELFRCCHAAEFNLLGLDEAALAQLLALQYRGRNMTYASRYPMAEDSVILSDGERAGRLLLDRGGDVYHVVDIAVAPALRGRGLATSVLQRVQSEAAAKGARVQLHMRPGNPAVRLYQRLGFVVTGGDGTSVEMTWIGQQDQAGHTVAPPVPAPVAQDTTLAYFRTLVGQGLAATVEGAPSVELTLDAAEPVPANAESFTLTFSGPAEPALPSTIAAITPPGAQPMGIFLVPLGPREGRMQYEAVFNRSQA